MSQSTGFLKVLCDPWETLSTTGPCEDLKGPTFGVVGEDTGEAQLGSAAMPRLHPDLNAKEAGKCSPAVNPEAGQESTDV
jgi:hypothetical protein